ncbi:Fe(3+)-citrate-binding protein YfmC precursor [Actinomadura rubteroloni]|uniref:Fe(3+)-citrate-binding protein YfmC n=1 Tax=Actinomadura rubteroloni TaxID=1926885 RepID=A0A2P4UGP7_9ACTN|nr:ABC transporter substrate-binding protein [Actinomadura rubteroloni]POM24242.1 Fe(3+)-citrate-binding protein YfmC precursor [Actinomadura rubteroloni]
MPAHLTRRGLLSAGGGLTLAALLAACGDGGSGASGGAGWTFTDDRGTKISLKARPKRVVAYVGAAAALHDFGVVDQIVGVYGPAKRKDGSRDPQVGEVDVNKVTIIGNAYGEFNIEKYAALRPELLVDHVFVQPDLFYVPHESKDKIYKLAPSAGIATGAVPLPTPIEHYAALARALGADTRSPAVTAAKARFDKAVQAVRDAVRANPGITVLAAAANANLFYASSPGKNSDLIYFKQLGVGMIQPDNVDKDGYFEHLSWENADKYKADVILLDARTQSLQPKDLESKATWKRLPAVRAGQVHPWDAEPRFSYAGAAPLLERLATAVRTAKKVA